MIDLDRPCATCNHGLKQHGIMGCYATDCDCHYYSVSETGLTSLSKRPTKEEALPHTMDPPKPLTAEELADLSQRIEVLRQRNIRELGESTLIALHDCEWLSLKAYIDHLTRRAEEAEKLVEEYKIYAASMEPWKIWAVDELTKRGYEWKPIGA